MVNILLKNSWIWIVIGSVRKSNDLLLVRHLRFSGVKKIHIRREFVELSANFVELLLSHNCKNPFKIPRFEK